MVRSSLRYRPKVEQDWAQSGGTHSPLSANSGKHLGPKSIMKHVLCGAKHSPLSAQSGKRLGPKSIVNKLLFFFFEKYGKMGRSPLRYRPRVQKKGQHERKVYGQVELSVF